jgi:type III secretion protein D
MLELRILNGLHRGATLPLDERPLVIGASDDADVVLVDPGIETEHATLTLTAQGWSLSTLDGAVLGADHNRPHATLDLEAGDFARLGHVWMTVVDSESPWENPPPEPADSDVDDAGDVADAGVAGDADSMYEQVDDHAHAEAEENEPYRDSPLDDPQHMETEASAIGVQTAPKAEAAGPAMTQASRPRWHLGRLASRRSKMIFVPLALATVVSACAAYTMTTRTSEEAAPKTSNVPSAPKLSAMQLPQPKASKSDPQMSQPKASKPDPQMSQMELREAFRTRLKEVDLLKRFDLKLRDNAWTMQAALDDEEAIRFERMLTSFIHTHNIKFPVNAKIGNTEAMLPFRVIQVISGSNASVVTQDGNRLYIGDEYRGLRLVAIEGNQLKFEGDRKIKVKW